MSDLPSSIPAVAGSPHSTLSIAARLLAAVAIAAAAIAVQRLWLADDPVRDTHGATVRAFEVDSPDALGRSMPARVVTAEGASPKGRSLLVFLHGRGENERSYLVEPMFEALAGLGKRAPVVAFPYGGSSSYWHDRETGNWATYVLDDVVPQVVERFDIDPDRIAIGGISMGGFGAYDIARLDPASFCAVGGHSPAIWESASETAEDAFDDADDFDRNDVTEIARSTLRPYADLRLWLDAGDDDPFLAGDRAFEQAAREGGARPVVKSSPGGHDSEYWNGNWEEYFRFYAHALNECAADEKAGAGKPGAGGGGADAVPGREAGSGGPSKSAG